MRLLPAACAGVVSVEVVEPFIEIVWSAALLELVGVFWLRLGTFPFADEPELSWSEWGVEVCDERPQ